MTQETQTGALYQSRSRMKGNGREVQKSGYICTPKADLC